MMKASGILVFAVILLCFLAQEIAAAAYKDCSVECPSGCAEQKTCYDDSKTCICSCDCPSSPSPPKHHHSPPKHQDSPPKHHHSPPPKHHLTQPEKEAECLAAGFRGAGCVLEYLAALLDSHLQFSNYCCQNVLDVQTYCIEGNVPPQLAGTNIFTISYAQHCAKN